MTLDQCIDEYIDVSETVFKRKHWFGIGITGKTKGRFDTAALEAKVKAVVAKYDKSKNEAALTYRSEHTKCKVQVQNSIFQAVADPSALCVPRRRRVKHCVSETTQVVGVTPTFLTRQAARATTAATTFLSSIQICRAKETFRDGAFGANNPTKYLWHEASETWASRPRAEQLSWLLSLSTGEVKMKAFSDGLLDSRKAVSIMTLSAERIAKDFITEHRSLLRDSSYLRESVVLAMAEIRLEEAKRFQASLH